MKIRRVQHHAPLCVRLKLTSGIPEDQLVTTPTIYGPSIRLSLRSVLLAVGFTVIVLGALVDIAEFVESRRVETGTRAESVAATDLTSSSTFRIRELSPMMCVGVTS